MPFLLLSFLDSAALNLGCIPRRASRSQRHSNPVTYLSPNSKELTDVSQKPQDNNKINQLCSKSMLPPLMTGQSSDLHGSATQFRSKNSAIGPEIQFMPSIASKGQNPSLEIPNKDLACKARGFPVPVDLGFVYTLYHGEGHHSLPTPQSQPHMNPQELRATKPSPPVQCNGTAFIIRNASEGLDRVADCNKTSKLAQGAECDLSLRLGLPSPPSSDVESSWAREVEDVGSSSSCDGAKSWGALPNGAGTMNIERSLSSARDKLFDFFSVENVVEHYESCTSKQSSRGDCAFYVNAYAKNEKIYTSGALTDEDFSWKS